MSNLAISGSFCPSLNLDVFKYELEFLERTDIGRCARVCKLWHSAIKDPNVWKKLSERDGVPLVISLDGKERDYKKDYEVLSKVTISGKMIGQYFGKVVGKVPPISQKFLNKLQEPDPFEDGKLIGETFVFLVVPDFITRTIDENTPLTLDEAGNLKKPPEHHVYIKGMIKKHELRIPFSLKNLRVLCSYPLKGKENTPVFDKDSWEIVFDQCDTRSDKVRVYFMRKHVVEHSKMMSYTNQETVVKNQGFEVTSLRERALFDSITILESGKCCDGYGIYVRNSDTVLTGNGFYRQSVTGGFERRHGLRVLHDFSVGDSFCVVPGCYADTL